MGLLQFAARFFWTHFLLPYSFLAAALSFISRFRIVSRAARTVRAASTPRGADLRRRTPPDEGLSPPRFALQVSPLLHRRTTHALLLSPWTYAVAPNISFTFLPALGRLAHRSRPFAAHTHGSAHSLVHWFTAHLYWFYYSYFAAPKLLSLDVWFGPRDTARGQFTAVFSAAAHRAYSLHAAPRIHTSLRTHAVRQVRLSPFSPHFSGYARRSGHLFSLVSPHLRMQPRDSRSHRFPHTWISHALRYPNICLDAACAHTAGLQDYAIRLCAFHRIVPHSCWIGTHTRFIRSTLRLAHRTHRAPLSLRDDSPLDAFFGRTHRSARRLATPAAAHTRMPHVSVATLASRRTLRMPPHRMDAAPRLGSARSPRVARSTLDLCTRFGYHTFQVAPALAHHAPHCCLLDRGTRLHTTGLTRILPVRDILARSMDTRLTRFAARAILMVHRILFVLHTFHLSILVVLRRTCRLAHVLRSLVAVTPHCRFTRRFTPPAFFPPSPGCHRTTRLVCRWI